MFHEGQQIGLYTLIRKLGRGGFGEVWLAERRAKFVTTKVAVKLPHEEQIDTDAIHQEATLPILYVVDFDGAKISAIVISSRQSVYVRRLAVTISRRIATVFWVFVLSGSSYPLSFYTLPAKQVVSNSIID